MLFILPYYVILLQYITIRLLSVKLLQYFLQYFNIFYSPGTAPFKNNNKTKIKQKQYLKNFDSFPTKNWYFITVITRFIENVLVNINI